MSRRHFNHREEHDPVGMLSNLFDVAMVFAVALMVALVTKFNMTEIFSKDDFTIVKNPGKENMEIITKEGKETRDCLRIRKWRNYLYTGIKILTYFSRNSL